MGLLLVFSTDCRHNVRAKKETVRTAEDPTAVVVLLLGDSVDRVPRKFSGFNEVNRRIFPLAPIAAFLQQVSVIAT